MRELESNIDYIITKNIYNQQISLINNVWIRIFIQKNNNNNNNNISTDLD